MTNEGDHRETGDSEAAQQPAYEDPYLVGLTMKWKDRSNMKLASVISHEGGWIRIRIPNTSTKLLEQGSSLEARNVVRNIIACEGV